MDNVCNRCLFSNNIKPQAEETEVRSTLFSFVKRSHSSYMLRRTMCCTGGSPKISAYFVQIARGGGGLPYETDGDARRLA